MTSDEIPYRALIASAPYKRAFYALVAGRSLTLEEERWLARGRSGNGCQIPASDEPAFYKINGNGPSK